MINPKTKHGTLTAKQNKPETLLPEELRALSLPLHPYPQLNREILA